MGATHLIQKLKFVGTPWEGIESFRLSGREFKIWQVDRHYDGITNRMITIFPGEVEGADEAPDGFAMLPSNWPPGFNNTHSNIWEKRGRITKEMLEHATVYRLMFDGERLTLKVEDKTYTWP